MFGFGGHSYICFPSATEEEHNADSGMFFQVSLVT